MTERGVFGRYDGCIYPPYSASPHDSLVLFYQNGIVLLDEVKTRRRNLTVTFRGGLWISDWFTNLSQG